MSDRRFPAVMAALAISALAAPVLHAAETSKVSPAFGNTLVSTYPDGRAQKIWLHPDGTWDGLSRRGSELAGSWSLKSEKVCLKQSKPPTLPVAYCASFPDRAGVGVAWTGKDMAGTPIKISLVKGVQKPKAEAKGGADN